MARGARLASGASGRGASDASGAGGVGGARGAAVERKQQRCFSRVRDRHELGGDWAPLSSQNAISS